MPNFTHGRRFGKLVQALGGYPGATVREKAEAFALDCGFSKSDIEKFRRIMIE